MHSRTVKNLATSPVRLCFGPAHPDLFENSNNVDPCRALDRLAPPLPPMANHVVPPDANFLTSS